MTAGGLEERGRGRWIEGERKDTEGPEVSLSSLSLYKSNSFFRKHLQNHKQKQIFLRLFPLFTATSPMVLIRLLRKSWAEQEEEEQASLGEKPGLTQELAQEDGEDEISEVHAESKLLSDQVFAE